MAKGNHHAVHADALRVEKKLRINGRQSMQRVNSAELEEMTKGASPPPPRVPSIIAGIVHGIVVLMSFASFAFMIFGNSDHEELQAVFPLAISQQVMSASVLIGLLTFRGHFPFSMGGPTPPAALLVADVVRVAMDSVDDSDKKVPTAFIIIGLISIIMGLILLVLGFTGTAKYAQQLPYPVLCGFLGSVGMLLMRNAFQILIGIKLKWTFIPDKFDAVPDLDASVAVGHLFLGLGVAGLLLFVVPRLKAMAGKRKINGIAILPIIFIFPVVCFYAIAGISGMDFGAEGTLRTTQPSWLFAKLETKGFWNIWVEAFVPSKWDLGAIGSSMPHILIAAILCVLAALINMSGIEANAPMKKNLDLNSEFSMLGGACLVTGVLAGHPGHHVAAFTLPMKKDGGTTRVAPWTASFLWLAVFLSSAPLNSYVPRFFMGGCFLQVGFGLARLFLWDNRKSLDMNSTIIAWLMVLVSLFLDLNYSAGFGFVLVSLNHIRLSTEVDVVHSVTRLDMQRSPKQRTNEEVQSLTKYGHKVMMIHLNGYLFWGTVDNIFAAFAEIVDGSAHDPEVLYVNLEHVVGVEVSVVATFRKLHRMAAQVGVDMKLCGFPDVAVVGPQIDSLLRALPFANSKIFIDLLEESEDKILEDYGSLDNKIYVNDIVLDTTETRLRERRTLAKHNVLVQYGHATGSVYGIRWEFMDGVLHVGQSYNSDERARYLVKDSLESKRSVQSYVTHSASQFVDGEAVDTAKDILSRAYRDQKAYLCRDVALLSEETFPRQTVAQKYAIRVVVFVPTDDGVYEFGACKIDEAHASLPNIYELIIPPIPDCDVQRFAKSVAPGYSAPVREECAKRRSMMSNESTSPRDPLTPDFNMVTDSKALDIAKCIDELRQHFTWTLLLSMQSLGTYQEIFKGGSVVSDDDYMEETVADDMYIVLGGVFGTFSKDGGHEGSVHWTHDHGHLLAKCGVGSLLGAIDVFLQRPWSVKIVCLSDVGRLLRLDSKTVKKLETCDSPLVDLATSHEFVQYVKKEMALREVTMNSAIESFDIEIPTRSDNGETATEALGSARSAENFIP